MPRKKDTIKPRGRCTAYGFFLQTCGQAHAQAKLYSQDKFVFSEFSRFCSTRWKNMSPSEKQVFLDMADRDKQRYNLEMRYYVPPKEDMDKGPQGRKKRKRKDPNAPIRPLSAFFWFCQDERPKIRGSFPHASVVEVAKILGRLWAETGPEIKRFYETMSDRDKLRYLREKELYNQEKMDGIPAPALYIEV